MELALKPLFIERYKTLTDIETFKKYCLTPLRKCIRINTLKITSKELLQRVKGLDLKQIPWYKDGYWVENKEETSLGNMLEHKLGYFFVQEAASMIPPLVLNPTSKDIVLDACAAPGSKTTQMAQIMENKGLIIANDKTTLRIKALSANVQRCGVTNTVITQHDVRQIKEPFSKILLDVPCSSTGTIRGSTKRTIATMSAYKPNLVKSIAGMQKNLLMHCYNNLLQEKGTLVYSTCSLEPQEDEEVISHLIEKTDAKIEKIDLDIKSKVNSDDKELQKCIKLWPQSYDTEGFFIAKIKKP